MARLGSGNGGELTEGESEEEAGGEEGHVSEQVAVKLGFWGLGSSGEDED